MEYAQLEYWSTTQKSFATLPLGQVNTRHGLSADDINALVAGQAQGAQRPDNPISLDFRFIRSRSVYGGHFTNSDGDCVLIY